ncbi:T-cell surface glycoprotein CD4-like [Boleophthalmus pectinirostris]|uniref:T-cell surface glycoprotein CD4-like n=1 Tax=Boleophthalmus pectinirostris TaxID=150288 RepID=UPI00242C4476|nr:T-cell surface glycoprotein CD4-like [Boleophthalmus pectinirostris]
MKSALLFAWVLLSAQCAAETVVQTKPGGTASLKCGISDGVSVLKWLHNDQPVYTTNPRTGMPLRGKGEIVRRSRLKYERELEISQVTPADAGLFICRVKDKEEQHRLIVSAVSVAPPGPLQTGSGAVFRCDVSGRGGGSTVHWRGPDGQSYAEATVTLSHVTMKDSGSWECQITVNGKVMKESVQIQVREPRDQTTPPPSTTRTTVDNEETCSNCVNSTQTAPPALVLGLSWWVWAAIGGGFVVVLLWVLILIMYNQITRRKRRFMKMQKTKQTKYCQCPGPTAANGHSRTKPPAPPRALI